MITDTMKENNTGEQPDPALPQAAVSGLAANGAAVELLNMDCMELMKQYPDKYFDLAIVDPPYGIEINMNMGRRKGQPKAHEDKDWDNAIPTQEYFTELMRVSKNQIIWGG